MPLVLLHSLQSWHLQAGFVIDVPRLATFISIFMTIILNHPLGKTYWIYLMRLHFFSVQYLSLFKPKH